MRLRRGDRSRVSEATRSARRDTSARSCVRSLSEPGEGWEMAETDGAATSMTLSAMSARVARSIVSRVEARTILTLGGNRCRNSSLRKVRLASVP